MEPLLLDVKSLLKDSIYFKELNLPYLNEKLHYHNAYEMTYMLKSNGRRVIGDNIEKFTDGDLTLMAPHLPHISYTDKDCNLSQDNHVHALVVYFNPDWLTETYFNSPELIKVRDLFENLKRGIKIFGQTKRKVVKSIFRLKNSHGLERIITLLDILVVISKSEEYAYLASEGYMHLSNQNGLNRIDEVYRYVKENFKDKIALEHIASISNMTPTAFCKYFKKRTQKTFSNFVNEIRIGYACKLLCEENMNISQICYESGFNNLPNFNKNFKRYNNMIPSAYKSFLTNKEKA